MFTPTGEQPGGGHEPSSAAGGDDDGTSAVIHRNIRALANLRVHEEERKTFADRLADRVTAFAGSMTFVFVHALIYGGWFIANAGWIPRLNPWDPFPFVMLAVIASVEAIFLSTFILISQNRMQQMADRRAELNVQIDLLTEHELTRAIQMLDGIAQRLQAPRPPQPELDEIERDVSPEKVIQEIEKTEDDLNTRGKT